MATPSNDVLDLLAAYALDALEPQEMAKISELLQHDPELRALLVELRITTAHLPYALPETEPPPELRQKVLDYATGRSPRSQAVNIHARAPRMRRWLNSFSALAAAGFVAAALAFGQVLRLQAELNQTRAALEQQVALNRQVAEVVVNTPSSIALHGESGSATVLRTEDGQVVLAANLPPLAEGRVYQLWQVENGQPVSGGTFTVNAQGVALAVLPQTVLSPDVVFAVTEEPGPDGSSAPTSNVLITS